MAEFPDSKLPSGGHDAESSDTVIQKLKQAIYFISDKSFKCKSEVWEQFGVICNENIQLPFVACMIIMQFSIIQDAKQRPR